MWVCGVCLLCMVSGWWVYSRCVACIMPVAWGACVVNLVCVLYVCYICVLHTCVV